MCQPQWAIVAATENIAVNSSGCEALHTQWMNSSVHRANILNPVYTKARYGVVSVAGFIGTQVFTG
ncbi:MAG: hypothetical protein OEM94_06115 [Acidimicrobiia bacterium]|nr:hypothetical protein [Acidimicrobiia bacterium]